MDLSIFEQELHRRCHTEADILCKEKRKEIVEAIRNDVTASDERIAAYRKLMSDLDDWLTHYHSDLVIALKLRVSRNIVALAVNDMKNPQTP